MTRDEVLDRLRATRAEFDARVSRISDASFERLVPGGTHTPKQIVWHVSEYDRLMVERLRAAREGRTTAFERDRVGWEAFNERTWSEGQDLDAETVKSTAGRLFEELLAEVGLLSDDELAGATGSSANLDPAWLGSRAPWELIGIDGFDHYPMHFRSLEAAAVGQEG